MCKSEAVQASVKGKTTPGCGKRHFSLPTSRLSTGFRPQMCAAHKKLTLLQTKQKRENGFPPTNCPETETAAARQARHNTSNKI